MDVDRDGDLDLVIAQSETQQNELFLNDGRGNFSEDQSGRLPAGSDNTFGIKAFDANGDGYPDLYYVNQNQQNRLMLNDGRGFFAEAPAGTVPLWVSQSWHAAVGDLNRDNYPDLYLSEGDRRNTLLLARPFDLSGAGRPAQFNLLLPAAGDTVRSDSSITFTWEAAGSSGDPVRYRFILGADSLFTPAQVVAEFEDLATPRVTLQNIAALQLGSRYWWKVMAYNTTSFPWQSVQVHDFRLLEPFADDTPPQFQVLLGRSPVFSGYLNLYVVSSLELREDPLLRINLVPLTLSRVGTGNIWRAQYHSRASFIISLSGFSQAGVPGSLTEAYAATLLAGIAPDEAARTGDGQAWLSLPAGAGELRVLAFPRRPVTDEKLKSLVREYLPAGLDGQALPEALLAGDCFTFAAMEGELAGPATVTIRRSAAATGQERDLAVQILEAGGWRALETVYDPERGLYRAATDRLGTFALRESSGGPAAVLPRAYALSQNAPNPFNPSTLIRYQVPAAGDIPRLALKVYDLRGALVRTLVDRGHAPGSYAVEWDGRGDDGRDLPSGVYFYRLTAGATSITRKMVLLR